MKFRIDAEDQHNLVDHDEANVDEIDRQREFKAASAEFTEDGASVRSSPSFDDPLSRNLQSMKTTHEIGARMTCHAGDAARLLFCQPDRVIVVRNDATTGPISSNHR
jgi:hypothetical protein